MNSTAKFTNLVDMAVFCAEMTKQGVVYVVQAYDDNTYIVAITGF